MTEPRFTLAQLADHAEASHLGIRDALNRVRDHADPQTKLTEIRGAALAEIADVLRHPERRADEFRALLAANRGSA